MVPWRCSVRTAAPTRGARCGRLNSAHVRHRRPSPHPYPRPIRPAPSHSRRGLEYPAAPLRQDPNPHPYPRPIRPAPSRSRRGLEYPAAPLRQDPNPHPYPRPIRPAPSHSRRGLAHRRTYSPSPTPTPGLFGLPPPTPGGGLHTEELTARAPPLPPAYSACPLPLPEGA